MTENADYLIRVVVDNSPVSGSVAVTSGLAEEAREIHQTTPVATAALGRTLTLSGIMGATLKDEGKVTFQIQCKGPLGSLVSQGNTRGEVRGYVAQPLVLVPAKQPGKLNVEEAVGKGSQLVVVKDLGTVEPSIGSVEVHHGGIAADLAAYFVQSEQLPTACGAGVLVEKDGKVAASGGYLVHTPSGTEERIIHQLEENISRMDQISTLIRSGLQGIDIAGLLFAGLSFRELSRQKLVYRCQCSRKRVERALILLGEDELLRLLHTEGRGEINCPFCNETYLFLQEELEALSRIAKQNRN